MKAGTFTFRIKPEIRKALESIAASKEWSAGHLVNSILTEYVASQGKSAKAKKSVKRVQPAKPAAGVLRHSADLEPVASEPLRSIERSGPRQDAEDLLGKHGA